MMIRSRLNADEHAIWTRVGGQATLNSYVGGIVTDGHWEFIDRECRDVYESDSHIFAHGGLSPELPAAAQPDYVLRWKPFRDAKPHCSGKTLVCGHSTQRSGEPRSVGHSICIDTGVSLGGWLTGLDCSSGLYWQANEAGKTRRGTLAAPVK